jgi:hypothetical protein
MFLAKLSLLIPERSPLRIWIWTIATDFIIGIFGELAESVLSDGGHSQGIVLPRELNTQRVTQLSVSLRTTVQGQGKLCLCHILPFLFPSFTWEAIPVSNRSTDSLQGYLSFFKTTLFNRVHDPTDKRSRTQNWSWSLESMVRKKVSLWLWTFSLAHHFLDKTLLPWSRPAASPCQNVRFWR